MKDVVIVKAGEGLRFIPIESKCVCALDLGKKAVIEPDPDSDPIIYPIIGKAIVDDSFFETTGWKLKQVLR